ncbi:MAG: ABC transporter permease [Acidiferrobacterales bacterium]|nr:ABC transporter permease [Acidiferrobacterales bacterium]
MRDDHYVSEAPFDPQSIEKLSEGQEKFFLASRKKLIWWKLKRHKLAVWSGIILLLMYGSTLISEFISPYNYQSRHTDHIYSPPQRLHFFHEGEFIGPFVYGNDYHLNMDNLKREYTPNPEKVEKIRFFCSGDSYEFWGLVKADFHFFCPAEGKTLFLFGTDRLGRDMFSRIVYGARISLLIGLGGIVVSLFLGLLFGGLAGYYGGWVDSVIQRMTEIIRSFPELPLWMALSAILPVTWSPLLVFFGITVILALLDWTGLARSVRSKLLALREEDYCTAARLMGAPPGRIIKKHLLPGFSSHIIASATLSIPGMILGETALSFLGLGLRPPITSWGVLLNEAQNINVVALYPWLILPVLPVVVIILAFNFFGDGLRDAADPYK